MEKMPKTAGHLALIGLSGSGKSSVGLLLAGALGLPFVDTDREVERAAGMEIHRIFSRHGEEEFRRLEAEQVARALAGPPAVISLGGGAVVSERNRELIWSRATVVWLRADPEELARRLALQQGSEERPLLSGGAPAARLKVLLRERERYYSLAHVQVETDGLSAPEVAERVLAALGRARE